MWGNLARELAEKPLLDTHASRMESAREIPHGGSLFRWLGCFGVYGWFLSRSFISSACRGSSFFRYFWYIFMAFTAFSGLGRVWIPFLSSSSRNSLMASAELSAIRFIHPDSPSLRSTSPLSGGLYRRVFILSLTSIGGGA